MIIICSDVRSPNGLMGEKMNKQQTVSIGGTLYDTHTGRRVEDIVSSTHSGGAHTVHKKPSKSTTLSRKYVHAPSAHQATRMTAVKPRTKVKVSPMVSKFADIRPASTPAAKPTKKSSDIAPIKHPIQHKVEARASRPVQKANRVQPAALEIKHQAIAKALHQAKPETAPPKRGLARRYPRLVSAGTASLAILLLAGYFTYINLPSISVRVAAAQAGIDATYPSYQPSGYGIRGPVAYSNGEVSINFQSNTNPSHFTINQTKSGWDSSALLDNYVMPQSNNNYASYSDNGLTIYVYGNKAAWVNGGILHTIEGDAELSGDQIRRIATSM